MKAETLAHVKRELKEKSSEELMAICLRLAKYKVENKELLSFLLFHEHNVDDYVLLAKEEMEEMFMDVHNHRSYQAKKIIRKILTRANKHIKYASSKTVEIELLMHFCEQMKKSRIRLNEHTVLLNMYERQIMKIEKAIATLHEDLQYDYELALQEKNLRISYFRKD
jgi:hypothetical protein